MTKLRFSFIGALLVVICLLGMSASMAAAEEPTAQPAARVELTDMQKNEIANLHKEILMKKAQLINKYVEYGVFTEDNGKKIISHMEERYKKLEHNGFIPHWDDNKHHHKH